MTPYEWFELKVTESFMNTHKKYLRDPEPKDLSMAKMASEHEAKGLVEEFKTRMADGFETALRQAAEAQAEADQAAAEAQEAARVAAGEQQVADAVAEAAEGPMSDDDLLGLFTRVATEAAIEGDSEGAVPRAVRAVVAAARVASKAAAE